MLLQLSPVSRDTESQVYNEKEVLALNSSSCRAAGKNPVVDSARFVSDKTDLVSLDESSIQNAAKYVSQKLAEETYTPSTWRTHPLHLCPPETYSPTDPRTCATLDWIFLISSLNFSFWSEKEGTTNGEAERFGVQWRASWGSEERRVWTGYWSLVAAIDRALENGIPITDPTFYASAERCPDSLIASIFAPVPRCKEGVPLLKERIAVMREVGAILCTDFGGSFQGFLDVFMERNRGSGKGLALQLVQMVTETFPSFRDELVYEGRTVYFWKRAQILVAETWAAFYPLNADQTHPFFPQGVHELTMFADYRVPQILHHLGILVYPPELIEQLHSNVLFPPGSREELSIRAASILAVEAMRDKIFLLRSSSSSQEDGHAEDAGVSSVLIDFYLWDLAKRIERGQDVIEGVTTQEILPAHRTRSIWY